MLDVLLTIIAPHYCLSCGQLGAVLCESCKNNLQLAPPQICLLCAEKLQKSQCLGDCELAGVTQEVLGERGGVIRELIDEMKFGFARAHARICADLLDEGTTQLAPDICVVPLPSSPQRVRQRGFDHTKLIAGHFARKRHLKMRQLLRRTHNKRQVGSSRKQRFLQADTAYEAREQRSNAAKVLLLDDIVTTGASITAAKRCLEAAGYKVVGVIALAHQPLD